MASNRDNLLNKQDDQLQKTTPSEEITHLPVISNSDFTKLDELGSGGGGKVYRGRYQDQLVAIKYFALNDSANRLFLNNIAISRLNSPYTVKALAYQAKPPVLVTEIMTRGELSNVLKNNYDQFPWIIRVQIAADVSHAIFDLHSLNYVHTDIKSANILIDDNFHAKLADFDCTNLENKLVPGYVAGTLPMLPPEIADEKASLTKASDIYSFGLVLLEISLGERVSSRFFKDLDSSTRPSLENFTKRRNQLNRLLKTAERTSPSTQFVELIRDCTQEEPGKRPSSVNIMKRLEELRDKKPDVDPNELLKKELDIKQRNLDHIKSHFDSYLKQLKATENKYNIDIFICDHKDQAPRGYGFVFKTQLGCGFSSDPDCLAFKQSEAMDMVRSLAQKHHITLSPERMSFNRNHVYSVVAFSEENTALSSSLDRFDRFMDAVKQCFDGHEVIIHPSTSELSNETGDEIYWEAIIEKLSYDDSKQQEELSSEINVPATLSRR